VDDPNNERRDVRDVLREDRSRGRRPIDTDAVREREKRLEKCRELLRYGSEADLRRAIRALGLTDGSPEFAEAILIWRASH
jgi:hypothetical protein